MGNVKIDMVAKISEEDFQVGEQRGCYKITISEDVVVKMRVRTVQLYVSPEVIDGLFDDLKKILE